MEERLFFLSSVIINTACRRSRENKMRMERAVSVNWHITVNHNRVTVSLIIKHWNKRSFRRFLTPPQKKRDSSGFKQKSSAPACIRPCQLSSRLFYLPRDRVSSDRCAFNMDIKVSHQIIWFFIHIFKSHKLVSVLHSTAGGEGQPSPYWDLFPQLLLLAKLY